jgi:hypothetical protein
VLKNEAKAILQENNPAALTNKAILDKLNNPFKKQEGYVDKDGKMYDGFVEGRICISSNSQAPSRRWSTRTSRRSSTSGTSTRAAG